MKSLINHVTYPLHLFFIVVIVTCCSAQTTSTIPQQLTKGFTASPNQKVTSFQPLLSDSTGNFSLSFLRVNQHQLALAIVHVPSGESLWQANSGGLAQWSKHTELFFNGSLVLSDPKTGVFWSTGTNGDHVVLTRATNLQVISGQNSASISWQSFDFPSDTLVENQNFTSTMSLISSNGLYTMRLGPDFIGLYAKFKPADSGPDQIYLKHRALEAKADIVIGQGPIMVRISSDGFMGMYQNGSVPADIQSFNSYERSVPGPRRVRIESDGNLKGYYWSGSSWVLDYQAVAEPCELPSPCGPYGLCTPGVGCSCLNNQTQAQTGKCYPQEEEFGDFCSPKHNKYIVLRRTGVELPFKELMVDTKTATYQECERSCELNCTCWGAVYNNASGFCYTLDYPIQTILGVGDETKMGYFKVWQESSKKVDRRLGIGIGLLCGAIVVFLGVLGLGCYKVWKRKRSVKNRFLEEEDIVNPGPYKDLGCPSFGSIELGKR